jgi:eukaryotic-like serine/threonine-protein kinase
VAKARGRLQTTREGQLKGKISYMAPEQLDGGVVDRRADIFPAGSILWEVLVGRRLFDGASEAAIIRQLLDPEVSPPSRYARELIHFDEVIARALNPDPALRYPTAAAMAVDIEERVTPARASEVAAWAMDLAGKAIERRALRAARIEAAPSVEDAALPARDEPVPEDGATVEMISPHALSEGSRTLEMSQIYFDAAQAPGSTPRPAPASPAPPPAGHPGQQLQSSDRWSWPMSQVSSVSLTRAMPAPPPLPPARVRLLAASGAIAALLSAIVSSALLSLVPRAAPDDAPSAVAATASPPEPEPAASPALQPVADAGPAADDTSDAGSSASDANADGAAGSATASAPVATAAAPRPRPLKVSPPLKPPAGPVKLPAPRPAPGPTKR